MTKNIMMTAAVTVLVVAAVVNSNASAADSLQAFDSVDSLCSITAFVDTCKQVFSRIQSASNTTEVIRIAGTAVEEEIYSVLSRSDDVIKNSLTDPREQHTFDVCKGFIVDAIDYVRAVILSAGNLADRSFDLRNWMTGVVVNVHTCLYELEDSPELLARVKAFLSNTTELIDNAMTIIATLVEAVDEAVPDLPEELEQLVGGRSLIGEDRQGSCKAPEAGGYPHWMTPEDRRRLAEAGLTPNVTVAADGSGDVKTITEAVSMAPEQSDSRYFIYVKKGTYEEYVVVGEKSQNIFMYGDGATETIVTGSRSVAAKYGTAESATFVVRGKGFVCKDMGFVNTAGPEGMQAVALRVQANECAFFHCEMKGYQDTLYTHEGTQFYSKCKIYGTIDFIFGTGSAIIQHSDLIVRLPMKNQYNAVTADGRENASCNTGIVIHGCTIKADEDLDNHLKDPGAGEKIKTYLGRPWKRFATTVIMQSDIGGLVEPEGWKDWPAKEGEAAKTPTYLEYENKGPGAYGTGRAPMAKNVSKASEVMPYTVEKFVNSEPWLAPIGAQVTYGLK